MNKEKIGLLLQIAPQEALQQLSLSLAVAIVEMKRNDELRADVPDDPYQVVGDMMYAIARRKLESMGEPEPSAEELATVEGAVADLLSKIQGESK